LGKNISTKVLKICNKYSTGNISKPVRTNTKVIHDSVCCKYNIYQPSNRRRKTDCKKVIQLAHIRVTERIFYAYKGIIKKHAKFN
jgi:hypothetical protein